MALESSTSVCRDPVYHLILQWPFQVDYPEMNDGSGRRMVFKF